MNGAAMKSKHGAQFRFVLMVVVAAALLLALMFIPQLTGHTVLPPEQLANCPSGLVAYWNFDENAGTIAFDAFNVNNGQLMNGPIWTSGKVWNALQFDGVDDYVGYVGIASGGNITYSGGYTIHTFTSNGTFTVPAGLTSVECLVVAGGGGGGGDGYGGQGAGEGGGGAGGYVYNSSFAVTSQAYTITVGVGGNGGANTGGYNVGSVGSNSVFSTITAYGGGYGGAGATNGGVGGSGGGAGYNGIGGDADYISPRQGYDGGSGNTGSPYAGHGGGGSSAVGQTAADNSHGGIGGAGTSNSISGAAVTYAAGGKGADGWRAGTGISGTANTGNGGTGAGGGTGGTGGSGIVIIRYLTNSTSSSLWINPASTNVWEHVAYNGSTYFKNGVVGNPTAYPLKGFTIGMNATGSSYFNGLIDEVAIYNRSLSASEIQQQYQDGLSGQSVCKAVCTDGEIRACTLQQGVCTGSSETCIGGTWNSGCDYTHIPGYSSTDPSCDNVDNNCNGLVDEGYGSHTCGVGGCSRDSVCSNGAESCTPGAPSAENTNALCSDGIDNNCNGLTDFPADPSCAVGGGSAMPRCDVTVDMNGDGKLDILDLIIAQKISLGVAHTITGGRGCEAVTASID